MVCPLIHGDILIIHTWRVKCSHDSRVDNKLNSATCSWRYANIIIILHGLISCAYRLIITCMCICCMKGTSGVCPHTHMALYVYYPDGLSSHILYMHSGRMCVWGESGGDVLKYIQCVKIALDISFIYSCYFIVSCAD